jgi:4-hydroxybenzoate polyprenyltransferase
MVIRRWHSVPNLCTYPSTRISLASIIAYALALIFAWIYCSQAWYAFLIPAIAVVAYSIGAPGLSRLKDIPLIKNLVIALAWDMFCALITGVTWPMIILISVLSFVNSALYDIRDVEGDRIAGVRTLAVVLGSRVVRVVPLLLGLDFIALALIWPLAIGGMMLVFQIFCVIYFSTQCRHPSLLDML